MHHCNQFKTCQLRKVRTSRMQSCRCVVLTEEGDVDVALLVANEVCKSDLKTSKPSLSLSLRRSNRSSLWAGCFSSSQFTSQFSLSSLKVKSVSEDSLIKIKIGF